MEPNEEHHVVSLMRDLAGECESLSRNLKFGARTTTDASIKASLLEASVSLCKIQDALELEAAHIGTLRPPGKVEELVENLAIAVDQVKEQVFPKAGRALLEEAAEELQNLESKFAAAKEACENLEARTELVRQYHSVRELTERMRLAAADAAE